MKQKTIQLSNNSNKWKKEAELAYAEGLYLEVHPSHILSLLALAKSFQYKLEDVGKVKKALIVIDEFLERGVS